MKKIKVVGTWDRNQGKYFWHALTLGGAQPFKNAEVYISTTLLKEGVELIPKRRR